MVALGDDEVGAGVAEEFRRVAGDGTAGDDDEGVGKERILAPRADLAEGLALRRARDGAAVEDDGVWRFTFARESPSGREKLRRKDNLLRLVQAAAESFECDSHKELKD